MNASLLPKKEDVVEINMDNLSAEEPKKTCVVCGDKALGYNFNAITCESCKAFFRRNALKKKIYKCRFAGDCEITVASRRYCQKCRLLKCFQVGMMPELITVHPAVEDGEPQEPCWPLSMARKRRSQDTGRFDHPPKFHVPDRPVSVYFSRSYQSQDTIHSAASFEDLSETRVPPTPMIGNDLSDFNLPSVSITTRDVSVGPSENEALNVLSNDCIPADHEDPMVPLPKSVLMRLIQLCHRSSTNQSPPEKSTELQRFTPAAGCQCHCSCGAETRNSSAIFSSEFDQADHAIVDLEREIQPKKTSWTSQAFHDIDHSVRATDKQSAAVLDLVPAGPIVEFPPYIDTWKLFRLEELLSANEILLHPRQQAGPLVSYADAALAADMMNLAIRRTVSMLKCISAFNTLSTVDQIALFKGGIRELMCLRGMMVYEKPVNSFRPVGYPHRYLRLDAMKLKPDGNLTLKGYYDSYRTSWRKCDPIMLCLKSMVLFEPTRPNVVDFGSVMSHQQFYRDLLKCYLRTVYSPLEAEDVFKMLLDRLQYLRDNLKDYCPVIHIEMSPRDLEPLLIDIIP